MLGAFSLSLNVKDIHQSLAFYQKLGFDIFYEELENNWLILKQGDTMIGLFQGIITKNYLTFNPGWDQNAKPLKEFDDIRVIKKRLIESGIEIKQDVDRNKKGPAHFMIEDPDGNPIFIDQHV